MINLTPDEKFDIDILLTLVRTPDFEFIEERTFFDWIVPDGSRIALGYYPFGKTLTLQKSRGWKLIHAFSDGNTKRLGLGISEIRDLFADPEFRRTHGLDVGNGNTSESGT